MFIGLAEEDMTFFESLEKGGYLLFNAKVTPSEDFREGFLLTNITNIRSAYQ